MPEAVQRGASGEYRIYAEIGAGGMASVHLGRFLGTAGFARTVAIKRPLPNLQQNPDFRRFATREALLAARVQHPNVVATLDVIDSGRELWIVMEYVHGTTLSTLAGLARERGERVPVAIAVALIGGVLRGLSAVHQARSERGELLGLVHRDVSPQNILCGADGVARLADFGLARASGDVGWSHSDQFKGKLTYAAPEQVELLPLTYAADLYAVGVVLWELLTGERMYRNRTAAELIAQLLHAPLVAPSTLVPSMPRGLDAIVLRALSRAPTQRQESALALAAALEEVVRPASVEATAEWIGALAAETLRTRGERVTQAESETTPSQRQPQLASEALRADEGLEPTILSPAVPPAALPSPAVPAPPQRDRSPAAASRARGLRHVSIRVFALVAGVTLAWLVGEQLWPRARPQGAELAREEAMRALASSPAAAGHTRATASLSTTPPTPQAAPSGAGGAGGLLVPSGEQATVRLRGTRAAAPSVRSSAAAGGQGGAPGLDCSPPFSLDAEGIRHMKPGCQ